MKYRIEKDSMGNVEVPENAMYSGQTQRAIDNFKISGQRLPAEFIGAVALIKKVAAQINRDLKLLDKDKANAIVKAADGIIEHKYADQFPIDVFQTGSGTSTNMNVNEVIAVAASKNLGKPVSQNDDVNMSQSSNDVIPSAIAISSVMQIRLHLLPAMERLERVVTKKSTELGDVCKTGRTHLMDAMPMTMRQELLAWASLIKQSKERITESLGRLSKLPQGGTAVGTGINAHPEFSERFNRRLSELTGMPFVPHDSLFAGLSSQDNSVEMSGQLKAYAVNLMKISNDLRWMNSGPLAGLAEIELEALQPGSSIMPGKINPVIPEAVTMVCAQVIGNDAAITIAGQSGNFQLNVMLPLIANNMLHSVTLLSNASTALSDKTIASFTVNSSNLDRNLAKNPILATALNPIIGYMKSAEIVKKAYKEHRTLLDVALEMTDLKEKELKTLLDPKKLAGGGI